ncbi:MAG: SDR family NAD(P)-dependent oxidoreductase [Vicinamibacterales bacterium]
MNRPRVVAITGASAGIGRATARRFARDGAAVVICARRAEQLSDAAREVEAAGGQVFAVQADVRSSDAMRELVDRALQRFGRLDALVCNAGFGIYGAIEAIDDRQMERLLDVNYMGTYRAIRAALPVFREQQSGHIFVISSIVGQRGIPFMGAYAATKSAQAGLCESLRAELRGTGIHLSTVYPISTETEFFSVMTRESGVATRARGPRQDVETVANAIVRAYGHRVAEIYPYPPAKLLAILNAVAPGLCDLVVKRWRREPLTADAPGNGR